jgi:hypothetical protein
MEIANILFIIAAAYYGLFFMLSFFLLSKKCKEIKIKERRKSFKVIKGNKKGG